MSLPGVGQKSWKEEFNLLVCEITWGKECMQLESGSKKTPQKQNTQTNKKPAVKYLLGWGTKSNEVTLIY